MDKIKVLLVEDEQTLAMIIKDTLEAQHFIIHTAGDGEEGLSRYFALHPDVIVADVMMPRMDGFEMVRRIRATDRLTPVLFLSARSAVNDVVEGFGLGADDYLKKPFGMQELMVRIQALASRATLYRHEGSGDQTARTVEIGRYRLDLMRQTLCIDGHVQELSHRETAILHMLADHHNQIVETRNILLREWGSDSYFNVRSLHVFITKLRHRLADDPHVKIINVRGIGYKMIP